MNPFKNSIENRRTSDKYIIGCFIIVILFFIVSPIIALSSFYSTIEIHASLEMVSSFIAYMAALACIVYYLNTSNRFFLIISLGFYICATENLFHGILVYHDIIKMAHMYVWNIIPGTYISGRWSALGIMIITAAMLEHDTLKTRKALKRNAVIFSVLAIFASALATILAFYTPLPDFIYSGRIISRPIDFITAIMFCIAFMLIVKRFVFYRDIFSGTLLACIVLNIYGEFYLSFSKQLFDTYFEVAQWSNVLSYCFPVLGITFETIQKNKIIEQEIVIRKEAEEKVRMTNEKLEQLVIQRTEKLEKSLHTLKETQQQLIQSEKLNSLGMLSAGIAHEINNPISFVTSNISTAEEYILVLKALIAEYTSLESEVKLINCTENISNHIEKINNIKSDENLKYILNDIDTVLSEIKTGAERIKDIIKNLRSFAHIDKTAKDKVNINKELEVALKIAYNELKYKCTVHKQFGDIPLISCYPGEINQVFLNLIVNAAQAIQTKGTINICTFKEDNNVVITIEDTGTGISEKDIGKIFDPFFTTKDVGKGTGLGLSVSHGIIEKHKGTIGVESKVNKGTKFTIKLPLNSEVY